MIAETLAAIVAGYLVLIAALAALQRGMVYHPGKSLPDPADAGIDEMVPCQVRTQDGWIITGWYAPPRDRFGLTVLFFQGDTGTQVNRIPKARALIEQGHGVMLAGYRGYGGNPGRPTEKGLYADGRAALGWLRGRGIPVARIVLYGESLGAAVAAQIASETENLGGIVLEAPFTSLADLAPLFFLPGMTTLARTDRYDTIAAIPKVKAPILILHGEQDDMVPVEMGRQILARARHPREGFFVEGGGHTDLWKKGAEEKVAEFLAQVEKS